MENYDYLRQLVRLMMMMNDDDNMMMMMNSHILTVTAVSNTSILSGQTTITDITWESFPFLTQELCRSDNHLI